MTRERVAHEPAFVLHHHDWSESSLILEVFTRHHGRVALVAKGAKKATGKAVKKPAKKVAKKTGKKAVKKAAKKA